MTLTTGRDGAYPGFPRGGIYRAVKRDAPTGLTPDDVCTRIAAVRGSQGQV